MTPAGNRFRGVAMLVAVLSSQGAHSEPLDSLSLLEPSTDLSQFDKQYEHEPESRQQQREEDATIQANVQDPEILPDPAAPPSSLSLLQAGVAGAEECDAQSRFDVVMCQSHMCTECALEWCFKSCQKIQSDYPGCRCADWASSRETYSGEGWAGAGKYGDNGEYSQGVELMSKKSKVQASNSVKQAFPSLALLEMNPNVQPLSPSLEPESHDKFFDHDYPDDQRVEMHKGFNFQHPYPVLQDSEDYDKDYTKDENSDGGQWKAQTAYDTLRAKKSAKVIAAKRAWANEASLEKELDDAKKSRDAKAEAAAKAKADADAATAAATAAEAKAKALSSQDAMKSEIDSTVAEVETDVTTLEDCKKHLADAKEKLKVFMKDKEDHEGVRAVEAEQAKARAVTQTEEADALSKDAAEKATAAEDLKAKAPEVDADLASKISAAAAKAEAAAADAKSGQGELERAAIHLRGVRHQEVDDDGGVYYHHPPAPTYAPYVAPPPRPTAAPPPAPKSGAAARVPAVMVSLLALAAAFA
jgi:hypothetical protein